MENVISQASSIQKKATNIDCNIYLSASAGTGKTKTLIDRIMVILLKGVNFKNILAITYTNAAANEMLTRVTAKLRKWQTIDKSKLSREILDLSGNIATDQELELAANLYNKYLENYETAKIQTIHSLCIDILNRYNQLHGLNNSRITVLDDATKNIFLQTSFEQTINQTSDNKILSHAIDHLSRKYSHEYLFNLLSNILKEKIKLSSFLKTHQTLNELIEEQFDLYNANCDLKPLDIQYNFLKTEVQNCYEFIQQHSLESLSELSCFIEWHVSDQQKRKFLLNDYLNFFLTKTNKPRKKIPIKKELIKDIPEFADIYFNEQTRVIDYLHKYNSQEQAEFTKNAIIIINQMSQNYEQLKNEAALVDFDDLILNCINLFTTYNDIGALMLSLDQKIDHILIDEAQDLSDIQWFLLKKIISSQDEMDSIFIIGDYKQSIYSFQGAEPEFFLAIQKLCQTIHKKQKKWLKLELLHSFRSQKTLLTLIDQFFINTNSFPNIKHLPIKQDFGKLQLIEIEKNKTPKKQICGWNIPEDSSDSLQYSKYAAQEIAKFVIQLLSQNLDLNPQDIMILFRKRGEKMHYLIKELEEYNFYVTQINRVDLNKNLVIADLLSLLKFSLTPKDDLNLAGLLKSPFFRLSNREIHSLSYKRKDVKIWDIINQNQHHSFAILAEVIEVWREKDLFNFYSHFIFKKNYIKYFFDCYGHDCEKIINLFLQRILEYQSTRNDGSHSFLKWLDNNSVFPNEITYPESIKVITTHAAKGLQSKIVIIADADDSENKPNENYFWHDNKLIIPYNAKADLSFINQSKLNRKQKIYSENIRLLYVAMTRAEDELYIFGSNSPKNGSWFDMLRNEFPDQLVSSRKILKDCSAEIKQKEQPEIPEFFCHEYIPKERFYSHAQASLPNQQYNDKAVSRGEFIHKLLSHIASINSESLSEIAFNLARNFPMLNYNNILEIIEIANELLNLYPELFHIDNLFEFNIQQKIENKNYQIQIDLLIIENKIIKIFEIKTDKTKKLTTDKIDQNYLQQLSVYKKCIKSIYPYHAIECYLLSFFQKKIFHIKNLHV